MPSDIRARAIDAPSSAAGSSREETRAVERDVVCAPVRVRVLPRDACVRAPRCCARATRHREDAPFQAGCPTDRNPGRPDSNPCAFPVEEINIWRKARERRRARRLTPARRRRPARTFAAHSRRRHGARSGVPRAHPARAGRSSSRERARARRRFPLFAFRPNVPRVASRARRVPLARVHRHGRRRARRRPRRRPLRHHPQGWVPTGARATRSAPPRDPAEPKPSPPDEPSSASSDPSSSVPNPLRSVPPPDDPPTLSALVPAGWHLPHLRR